MEKPYPPKMDLRDFMDGGYLQEVNRQFLHRLGLAMFVTVDEDTGDVTDLGVYDDRGDPEGWNFLFDKWPDRDAAVARFKANVEKVEEELAEHKIVRERNLGYDIQPVEFILSPGA